MAYTLQPLTQREISLGELVARVERTLDPDDEDTILDLAPDLLALSKNRRFVTDFLARRLREPETFQRDNTFTPATFVLARTARYCVRVVLWDRVDDRDPEAAVKNDISLVDLAHDHSFSVLTVGYAGPGYRTRIYEYDHAAVRGEVGERVASRFLEETTLPEGKVMFYRRSKDAHTQHPAAALSMSLNLIVYPSDGTERSQYIFDPEVTRIVSMPPDNRIRRAALMEIASAIDRGRAGAFD